MSDFVYYAFLDVPSITGDAAFMGIFKGLTGLEIDYDVYEFAEGGNNDFVHRLPGRMRYPNLILSWGLVNDEALFKWFAATGSQAQLQEISVSLTPMQSSGGAATGSERKFTFIDAFPVRWSGPQLVADNHDPEGWGETLEIAHAGMKLT